MNDNLRKLEKSLTELLLNDNYKEDSGLIKETIVLVNSLHQEENITEEVVNKINDNINELNFKYVDLFDLTNLYDPLKHELEKHIRDKYVSNLRMANREKRSEK